MQYLWMNKESSTQRESKIVASVQAEMEKPRLTESVREIEKTLKEPDDAESELLQTPNSLRSHHTKL